jgi:para-nitrobenzyl esterase
MGYDLSKALGAAHALEIAFVFGNFTEGLGLGYLYDASDEKDVLSNSMMSYWTQFAYTGSPGTGRDGSEVEWLSWGTDGKSAIILDTPSDQGIFMMSDVVSKESIMKAIAGDPEIADQRERCTYYVRSFRWSGDFVQAEYDNLGAEGCAAYDPADLDGF